jgi:FtsH-binding integral membrane protein
MGLAIAAAALAIFAVLQPAFESSALAEIEKNTLLQKETGWLIVACAVGIVGSVFLYRIHSRRATTWAMLVVALGAVILGATVYQVTGGRDALEGGSDLLVLITVFHGSPAAGLHAAEAAGLLAVLAGLMLAFLSLRPLAEFPDSRAQRAEQLARVAGLRGHPPGSGR